jgi:hypothetical protein
MLGTCATVRDEQAACSIVKLIPRLTIGIEGKARLPYVETIRAKTGGFLNVQRGQIL